MLPFLQSQFNIYQNVIYSVNTNMVDIDKYTKDNHSLKPTECCKTCQLLQIYCFQKCERNMFTSPNCLPMIFKDFLNLGKVTFCSKIFIAGRPKAALLFWFFGDFRCGALLFMVIHVIYKYKNR